MRAAYTTHPIPIPIRAARCPSIADSRDNTGKDIVCFPIYTSADTMAEASHGRTVSSRGDKVSFIQGASGIGL